ncbi:hypothetical protein D2Q93_13800 [Alicyclobacillaceae bacterium I2511]|nr:hypothetical protein D2Q93_13800 [Alicyclobacillaceae bacterium I2511]
MKRLVSKLALTATAIATISLIGGCGSAQPQNATGHGLSGNTVNSTSSENSIGNNLISTTPAAQSTANNSSVTSGTAKTSDGVPYPNVVPAAHFTSKLINSATAKYDGLLLTHIQVKTSLGVTQVEVFNQQKRVLLVKKAVKNRTVTLAVIGAPKGENLLIVPILGQTAQVAAGVTIPVS